MYLQAHVSHTGQSLLSNLLNGSHSETIQTPTSLHCSNKLILKDSGMVCKAAIVVNFLPILQLFQMCSHQ